MSGRGILRGISIHSNTMRSSTIIWIVIAAIVVIGGAFLLFGRTGTGVPTTATTANAPLSDDGTPAAVDAADDAGTASSSTPDSGTVSVNANATAHLTSVTVTYNGSSFSPSTVTIQKGGTVNFVSTAGAMWVASAPHPSHTGYDGTDRATHCAAGYTGAAPFDQCASGTSFSFTFNKTGSWQYHDHMNTGAHGTVIVQ